MIIKYTGREPDITGQLLIGNRGDVGSTTLIFQVQKVQQNLDLSLYTPSIEWKKSLGGQDIVMGLESIANSLDLDYIDISWTLSKEIMKLPGRGSICINFLSSDEKIVYRTNNLPIYVKDTINVDETLLPSIPESYRAFMRNVEINAKNIQANSENILANNTQEGWIYPTLLNNVLSLSANKIRYKKDNTGKTYIIGAIRNSDGTKAGFQLVNGYRMEKDVSYFMATSKNGNTLDPCIIDSDGRVYISVPDDDIAYINLIFINKGEI